MGFCHSYRGALGDVKPPWTSVVVVGGCVPSIAFVPAAPSTRGFGGRRTAVFGGKLASRPSTKSPFTPSLLEPETGNSNPETTDGPEGWTDLWEHPVGSGDPRVGIDTLMSPSFRQAKKRPLVGTRSLRLGGGGGKRQTAGNGNLAKEGLDTNFLLHLTVLPSDWGEGRSARKKRPRFFPCRIVCGRGTSTHTWSGSFVCCTSRFFRCGLFCLFVCF